MRITDGKIGHHESFDDKGSFIESIRGLNLILHSLPAEVRELAIHSDMLDWNKFRQKAENHGIQVRLEDFEDWIGNARTLKNEPWSSSLNTLLFHERLTSHFMIVGYLIRDTQKWNMTGMYAFHKRIHLIGWVQERSQGHQ